MKKYINNNIAIEVPEWCHFIAVDYSENIDAPIFAYENLPEYNQDMKRWETAGKKENIALIEIDTDIVEPSKTLLMVYDSPYEVVTLWRKTLKEHYESC